MLEGLAVEQLRDWYGISFHYHCYQQSLYSFPASRLTCFPASQPSRFQAIPILQEICWLKQFSHHHFGHGKWVQTVIVIAAKHRVSAFAI
jgi:hypothetical protein